VNVVHDLNPLPPPFADSKFALIVLEHVNCVEVSRKLRRILRSGGTLKIQVRHFTSADNYIGPTHIRRLPIRTIDFFVTTHPAARHYYFDFAFTT